MLTANSKTLFTEYQIRNNIDSHAAFKRGVDHLLDGSRSKYAFHSDVRLALFLLYTKHSSEATEKKFYGMLLSCIISYGYDDKQILKLIKELETIVDINWGYNKCKLLKVLLNPSAGKPKWQSFIYVVNRYPKLNPTIKKNQWLYDGLENEEPSNDIKYEVFKYFINHPRNKGKRKQELIKNLTPYAFSFNKLYNKELVELFESNFEPNIVYTNEWCFKVRLIDDHGMSLNEIAEKEYVKVDEGWIVYALKNGDFPMYDYIKKYHWDNVNITELLKSIQKNAYAIFGTKRNLSKIDTSPYVYQIIKDLLDIEEVQQHKYVADIFCKLCDMGWDTETSKLIKLFLSTRRKIDLSNVAGWVFKKAIDSRDYRLVNYLIQRKNFNHMSMYDKFGYRSCLESVSKYCLSRSCRKIKTFNELIRFDPDKDIHEIYDDITLYYWAKYELLEARLLKIIPKYIDSHDINLGDNFNKRLIGLHEYVDIDCNKMMLIKSDMRLNENWVESDKVMAHLNTNPLENTFLLVTEYTDEFANIIAATIKYGLMSISGWRKIKANVGDKMSTQDVKMIDTICQNIIR